MTALTPADLVAEALAKAEDAVPQSIGKRHDQYVIVDEDRDIDDSGWGLSMMANEQHVSTRKPRVVYVRHDAMLAALAHLAARVVAERERAEARAWYLAVLVMAGRAWAESAQLRIDAWALLEEGKDNWSAVATLRQAAAAKRAEADALYGHASRAEVSL